MSSLENKEVTQKILKDFKQFENSKVKNVKRKVTLFPLKRLST